MIWDSFSAFLHMGGYGLYVWGSFGVTALLLALETGLLCRHAHRIRDDIRMRHDARPSSPAGQD
jgi:heme exporter protein CcmD